MTEHEIILLRRHLESAIRRYLAVADELDADNFPAMAEKYRLQAGDARMMLEKLESRRA